ncbi:hypothetical protein BDY21DRAFT_384712 [Lineolata rhizophorae]|uniref:Zn(2)-C6 fungal-type domain-containing protein n=1 Tax=Lineolata rhizophorae TaxID=578093 RepID=A0A6A6P6B2_9PEZI|nr:hypothetical protein BDY21DRAFT_384712 [Lineolata rhizophorae]
MSMPSGAASVDNTENNIRKRVCKACDRCRLKKSKCDGASPCSRCKADNAICVFGERKKSHDKVYPKGYVEMLEQQQAQLVAAMRELYRRIQAGERWPGSPLEEQPGGHPLTHDILERLDLLHIKVDGAPHFEGFEENPALMQRKLLEGGATLMRRRGSTSSESDHSHAASPSSYGTPTSQSISHVDFSKHAAPPTPPMNSPFPRQSQLAPNMKVAPQFPMPSAMMRSGLDPAQLMRSSWAVQEPTLDDGAMEYMNNQYEGPVSFDTPMAFDGFASQPPISTSLDWPEAAEIDFNNFINPVPSCT